MLTLGYALSSEEHPPTHLVRAARQAEESGFAFALISDHFHPWVDAQGQSPFVWSVLGGIAHATQTLQVGTGVTCPILRTHPAIIAQAAATTAAMMPGRFFLGVGTGENLNEHVLGDPWPPIEERQMRLIEAIHILRQLWEGEEFTYDGIYYTVHQARIYTLPDTPPPIYMAASGPDSAAMGGELTDGLISTNPGFEVVQAFQEAGGADKPRYGQMKICWAPSVKEARETMRRAWPVSALSGRLHSDLPTPSHFEDAIKLMDEPKIPPNTVLGPQPEPYLEAIQELTQSGYTHIYLHQVGPDQSGFFAFFQNTLKPLLETERILG